MKVLIALCALALVFCFIGEAKAGEKFIPPIALAEKECVKRTYSDDGTSLTEIGCGTYAPHCPPGKTPIEKEDKTKPYPDCCPYLECVDESQ